MSTFASATGEVRLGDIRNHRHDMSDLVGGSFSADQIPDIPAAKVTSGTFPAARIPALPTSHISDQIPLARFPSMSAVRLPDDTPWARVQAAFAGRGWNTVGSYVFGGWTDSSRSGMIDSYVSGAGIRGSCINSSGWIWMRSDSQAMSGTWVNCGNWIDTGGRRVITVFHRVS